MSEDVYEATDAQEVLKSAQERNEIAREIVNLPNTYEVAGKTVHVGHKSIQVLVALNEVFTDLHLSRQRILEAREKPAAEAFQTVKHEMQVSYDLAVDALFYLINDEPLASKPSFTKEWIKKHLEITPGADENSHSIGYRIMSDYKTRMDKTDFFSVALAVPLL